MKQKWLVLSIAMFASTSVLAADEIKMSPKIKYADNLLMESKTAKRFETDGTDEANVALQKARDLLEQAKIAHQNGIPKQANALAGLALRKFTEAAKLLPASDSAQKVMRERYAELIVEINSYLEWYDSAEYVEGDVEQTLNQVKTGMALADKLYKQKKYENSNTILNRILNQVVEMTNRTMTSSTIVNSLDFATPEEEHKYELGRNNEYKRLIPIAIDQKKPSGGRLMLLKRFVKKAEDIRVTADNELTARNVEAAIKSLQSSTDQYLKALRMMGIR